MKDSITYQITTDITVKLGKRVVGKIKQVDGGWQYFPRGRRDGGRIWPTISLVKRDIEIGNDLDSLTDQLVNNIQLPFKG